MLLLWKSRFVPRHSSHFFKSVGINPSIARLDIIPRAVPNWPRLVGIAQETIFQQNPIWMEGSNGLDGWAVTLVLLNSMRLRSRRFAQTRLGWERVQRMVFFAIGKRVRSRNPQTHASCPSSTNESCAVRGCKKRIPKQKECGRMRHMDDQRMWKNMNLFWLQRQQRILRLAMRTRQKEWWVVCLRQMPRSYNRHWTFPYKT